MKASVSRPTIAALALATALVGLVSAPAHARAQASTLDVVGASTVTGLEAGIGTWVLAMPYGGFWRTDPQPGDGWAIALGLVVGAAHAVLSWGLVRGHPERAELVTTIAAGGGGIALAVMMLGGLYAMLTDFDRLAYSLVFGMPFLLAMTIATCVGLGHAIVEGDAPPTPMPSPLTVSF